jgi:hypothetical protein
MARAVWIRVIAGVDPIVDSALIVSAVRPGTADSIATVRSTAWTTLASWLAIVSLLATLPLSVLPGVAVLALTILTLTILPLLTILALLPVAALLAVLPLAIQGIAVEIAIERFEAIAQTLYTVDICFRSLIVAVSRTLLSLAHLLAQLLHSRNDLLFAIVVGGYVASTQSIRATLDARFEIILIEIAERIAKLSRRVPVTRL